MPYQHNSDLPDSVRSNLPEHGQEIYRRAFNSAWDQYHKQGDKWVKDES
jgi:cation transport regulator